MSEQPGTDTELGASLRLLHPTLWRSVMLFAVAAIALGVNFLVFTPTYLIFQMPNALWGGLLLAVGFGELVFLNFVNRLGHVRRAMAASVAVCLLLGAGTSEPFIHGVGSLQLPLMYLTLAVGQLTLILEPPVNPWNKRV